MLRLYTGLPWEAAPTSPVAFSGAGTIWLARTGGLPGRSLAGYRRWALTPPFHPSPVPDGVTPPRPSAGLLSVALDVAAGFRLTAPRALVPNGLFGREKTRPLEDGLCFASPRNSVSQPRVGRTRSTFVLN